MKDALATGELDSDVKGDVVFEMFQIVAKNNSCKMGLDRDQWIDAVEYAFRLFLVGWKNIVEKVNNEALTSSSSAEFHKKLYVLCLNACQIERRKAGF